MIQYHLSKGLKVCRPFRAVRNDARELGEFIADARSLHQFFLRSSSEPNFIDHACYCEPYHSFPTEDV